MGDLRNDLHDWEETLRDDPDYDNVSQFELESIDIFRKAGDFGEFSFEEDTVMSRVNDQSVSESVPAERRQRRLSTGSSSQSSSSTIAKAARGSHSDSSLSPVPEGDESATSPWPRSSQRKSQQSVASSASKSGIQYSDSSDEGDNDSQTAGYTRRSGGSSLGKSTRSPRFSTEAGKRTDAATAGSMSTKSKRKVHSRGRRGVSKASQNSLGETEEEVSTLTPNKRTKLEPSSAMSGLTLSTIHPNDGYMSEE
jgi:hypothetical protein